MEIDVANTKRLLEACEEILNGESLLDVMCCLQSLVCKTVMITAGHDSESAIEGIAAVNRDLRSGIDQHIALAGGVQGNA